MGTYAVIQLSDQTVVNIILWDGTEYTPATDDAPAMGWAPPEGCIAVVVPEGSSAGIDWTYEGGQFIEPPPAPVIPPTPAEILATNTARRNQLLAAATLAIAPLQDAVDIGEATSADTAMLTAWKTFRVAVNRVVLTVQNPTWPTPPQPGYGAAIAPPVSSS